MRRSEMGFGTSMFSSAMDAIEIGRWSRSVCELAVLLLAVVMGGGSACLAQEEPPEADMQEQVAGWVAQLDADSLEKREAAERALAEMGPAILSQLPPIDDAMAPEMRIRLERLREQLEARRVSDLVRPSRIRLTGSYTLREVIEQLQEQSGNSFQVPEELPDRKMEVDWQDELFWKALDQWLDEAGMDIPPFVSVEDGLPIRARTAGAPTRSGRAAYAGPFRVELAEAMAVHHVASPSQSRWEWKAWFSWEPRLKPVFLQFPMRKLVLETGDGTLLQPTAPDASPEYQPAPGANQLEAVFAFARTGAEPLPEGAMKMRGTFQTALPGETVQATIDALDEPGRKVVQVGNLSVSVDRIRKNGKLYEINARIQLMQAQQTMESFRSWAMNNEAYLLGPEGERLENVGWQTTSLRGTEVGLSYLFDLADGPKDHRFVYEAPGAVAELGLDWEIPDVPRP
jgi:hypothetical protein